MGKKSKEDTKDTTEKTTMQADTAGGGYSLTKEQIVFYLRKKKLYNLKEKRQSGSRLTYAEEQEEDRLKTELFSSVLKFGMAEAKKTLMCYRVDSETWLDIQQSFAEKFFEKLDAYDPLRSTPTTFYVRYFKEVISTYLSKNTLHLSQYDIKNSRKVVAAINYYEARGISWTEDMISTRTGLSVKVVKSTLRHRTNANYASVDDEECTQVAALTPDPEEMVLSQEWNEILGHAVTDMLSPKEWDILNRRLNLDGRKEKSFENIYKETGIPLKEVKSIYNSAIIKLGNSRDIQRLFNIRPKNRPQTGRMNFNDNAALIMKEQIFGQI